MVYQFNAPTGRTADVQEIEGVGPTTSLRFQQEYGDDALAEISRISRTNPSQFRNIKGIGGATAENFRQHMIDAGIYVPQPGDIFDQETTDATRQAVEETADNRFTGALRKHIRDVLQENEIPSLAKDVRVATTPNHAPSILIEAAEQAVHRVNIEIPVPAGKDITEPFSDEEFRQLTHDALVELWGEKQADELTSWVQDLLMPKREENLPETVAGVKESVRKNSIGYL